MLYELALKGIFVIELAVLVVASQRALLAHSDECAEAALDPL